MVRHIVIWNYADGFTPEQNAENAKRMKSELENLKNLIGGIVSIEVAVNPLPLSNMDIMLNSLFESEEALNAYQIHPEHVKAGVFVRSVTKNRVCFDYSE